MERASWCGTPVSSERDVADDSGPPTDSGLDQQISAVGAISQRLYVLDIGDPSDLGDSILQKARRAVRFTDDTRECRECSLVADGFLVQQSTPRGGKAKGFHGTCRRLPGSGELQSVAGESRPNADSSVGAAASRRKHLVPQRRRERVGASGHKVIRLFVKVGVTAPVTGIASLARSGGAISASMRRCGHDMRLAALALEGEGFSAVQGRGRFAADKQHRQAACGTWRRLGDLALLLLLGLLRHRRIETPNPRFPQ